MANAGSIVGIILVVLFVGCLAMLLFQGPTVRSHRARRTAIAKSRGDVGAFGNSACRGEHPSILPTRRPFPEGYESPPYSTPPPYALRSIKFAEHTPLDRSENSSKTTVGPMPSRIIPVLRSPPPAPPSIDQPGDGDETECNPAEKANELEPEPVTDANLETVTAQWEIENEKNCKVQEISGEREDMLKNETDGPVIALHTDSVQTSNHAP